MPHKRAKKSVRDQQRKGRGTDLAPPGDITTGHNGMGISTELIPKSAARVLDAAKIRAEYKQKKRARMQMEGVADTNDNDMGGATKLSPHKRRRTSVGVGAEKSKVLAKGKEHHPVDTQAIEIQPGESLKHFNRRVEDHMRPVVQSAMRASAATERKERKAAAASSSHAHSSTSTKTKVLNKSQQRLSSPPPSSSDGRNKSKASVKDAPSMMARRDNDNDDDHRPKEFAIISSAVPRRLNDIAMAPPELKKLPRGVKSKSQLSDDGGKAKTGARAGVGLLSMAQRVMMKTERESAIKRYREMKERKANEGDRTPLLTE